MTSPTMQYTNCDVAPAGKRFLMIQTSPIEAAATQINLVQGWFEDLKRRAPIPK